MSDLIAVVDTETTGIDEKKDKVIEASWAFVDVVTAKIVSLESRLFHSDTNEAEAINGIPVSLLGYGEASEPIDLGDVRAVLAHSAEFDRKWGVFATSAPWLCTKDDWTWPRAKRGQSLVATALAHGVGVVSAHRAYSDVLTLCATLERAHEFVSLRVMLAQAMEPRKTYAALVSYDDREKARAAGFRWVPETKAWVQRLPETEAAALPFKVRELAEARK